MASARVTGAGTTAANGVYTLASGSGKIAIYELAGTDYALTYDGGNFQWVLWEAATTHIYNDDGSYPGSDNPWDSAGPWQVDTGGTLPAPTVTLYIPGGGIRRRRRRRYL